MPAPRRAPRRWDALAAGLRERRYALAAWIVFEAGKPWAEADADVAEAIRFVEYYRAQARELQRPLTLGRRRARSTTTRARRAAWSA